MKMMRRNVLRCLRLVPNGREIVLKKGSLMIIVMMTTIVPEIVGFNSMKMKFNYLNKKHQLSFTLINGENDGK